MNIFISSSTLVIPPIPKFSTNTLATFGDKGGIPKVLDAGQCNDSYSLALIA